MSSSIWLYNICKKNSLFIDDAQLNQLSNYVDNLITWNQNINLISRSEENNIWQQQLLGSISFLFQYALEEPSTILDLGTGGGLPGIPLAILKPKLNVTLLDSIQKKINAITNILLQLSLSNILVICSRAEELGQKKKFQCAFDYIIARAVAPTVDIIRWGIPLLKKSTAEKPLTSVPDKNILVRKGSIIMLKGGDLTDEIRKARLKYPHVSITEHSIVIRGIGTEELVDKKVVIAIP